MSGLFCFKALLLFTFASMSMPPIKQCEFEIEKLCIFSDIGFNLLI
ncbi:hypothetical protein ABID22_003275 [Pontibacter aydingkolensis]